MPHSFTTERLLIRPMTARDAPAYWRTHNDPSITSNTGSWRYPFTVEDVRQRIGGAGPRRSDLWFAVIAADTYVGSALLFGEGQDRLDVGYSIGSAFTGHGFATEAARALCTFGFRTLKLKHIGAVTNVDNFASQRILSKIGFVRSGPVFYDWSAHYGKRTPCYRYGLIRTGMVS